MILMTGALGVIMFLQFVMIKFYGIQGNSLHIGMIYNISHKGMIYALIIDRNWISSFILSYQGALWPRILIKELLLSPGNYMYLFHIYCIYSTYTLFQRQQCKIPLLNYRLVKKLSNCVIWGQKTNVKHCLLTQM